MIRIWGFMLGTALLTSACERSLPAPHTQPTRELPEALGTQAVDAPFPERAQRLKIFNEMVAHIERLDGEGLEARRLRPQVWTQTVAGLRGEMQLAENFMQMGRVLSRLDATYTNLHSRIEFGEGLVWQETGRPVPRVDFLTRVSDSGRTSFHVDLASGEEITEINGRGIREWTGENFLFCKFPLQLQCDQDLFGNLFSELLSWKRGAPLKLTLRDSNASERTMDVPYDIVVQDASKLAERKRKRLERLECSRRPNAYTGFRMIYAGNRACVFEKDGDPSTAILRITSFHYPESSLFPEQPLRSLRAEVNALKNGIWNQRAGDWEHLVIDVIDNGGGNSPVPYYQLLFTSAFQEQYYRLKKSVEMEDPEFLREILWQDDSQLQTLEMLRAEGIWAKTPFGSLLPPIPMFCGPNESDCRKSLHPVRPHEFRGRVSLLLNQYCISSCDGFVWALKHELKDRVKLFGQPQAADSTYARARIDVEWNSEEGFTTKIRNQSAPRSEQLLLSQVVAVSLSTDATGQPLAGRPLALDAFVGEDPFDRKQSWTNLVLKASLR